MKIAILGDTHHGMRSDSLHFHDHYSEFYTNIFFPYLKANDVEVVFQLGDLFDRRKFINFQTLHLCKKYFFEPMKGYDFHTLLGNHDIAYKNTLEVNSSQLLLGSYKNITIHDKPKTVSFGGFDVDVIPWICRENERDILEFIQKSNSKFCFGHFELSGFEMDAGSVCYDGMDRSVLSKYDIVLSGHFHHRSSDGQIYYVGTPGEMTWADYGDSRGFHILDTEDLSLEFIENPYRMFHKISYDEKLETIESIEAKDFSHLTNKIVKLIVENKTNAYLFDMFFDKLYKSSPLDVSIVEDFIDYSEFTEEDVIDQAEDTITILDKYVENLEGLDTNRLKSLMREIYTQAQSIES